MQPKELKDAISLNNKKLKLAVVGPNANRTLSLGSNYAGCKNGAGGPFLKSCTFVNPLQGVRDLDALARYPLTVVNPLQCMRDLGALAPYPLTFANPLQMMRDLDTAVAYA